MLIADSRCRPLPSKIVTQNLTRQDALTCLVPTILVGRSGGIVRSIHLTDVLACARTSETPRKLRDTDDDAHDPSHYKNPRSRCMHVRVGAKCKRVSRGNRKLPTNSCAGRPASTCLLAHGESAASDSFKTVSNGQPSGMNLKGAHTPVTDATIPLMSVDHHHASGPGMPNASPQYVLARFCGHSFGPPKRLRFRSRNRSSSSSWNQARCRPTAPTLL